MEQMGPSSKHTARVLAVRLPSPTVSSISLKKITSSFIYFRQERSSSEINDRAPGPSHLEKKEPLLWEKKKKDKGKERKKKKKEGPFAPTESYFLLYCYWKSEKEQFFIRSPRGGTRWIEITYPLVPGK